MTTEHRLQEFFTAFYGRPAGTAGLSYWKGKYEGELSGQESELVKHFGADLQDEFQSVYGSAVTPDDFVNAVFNNLFGRNATTAGLDYWTEHYSARLSAGENPNEVRAKMVIWILDGAQDTATHKDATVVENRVSVAEAFTAAISTGNGAGKYVGEGSLASGRLLLASVDSSAASKSSAIASISDVVDNMASNATKGVVVDGYIKGATVFLDANGNGKLDSGEVSAVTGNDGTYTLAGGSLTGQIVVSGGTDISTNKPFAGILTAPVGSAVINPLTTLMQAMVKSGAADSLLQAEQKVIQSLGLAANTDLNTFDPIATALSSTASVADKAAAATAQAAAAKIANILVLGMSTLQGASAGMSDADAATQIANSLAANFATATGEVDLSSAATLKTVLQSAAVSAKVETAVQAALTSVSNAIAASNTKVDAAVTANPTNLVTALSEIAKVQVVAQSSLADAITSAMSSGSFTNVTNNFTGTALDSAVSAAVAGNLTTTVPATPTTPTTPPSSGGGGGGSSTPTPTFTVTKSLDSLNGTDISPATFNAASGDGLYDFTDSLATTSHVRISNFGSNDTLTFADKGNTALVFASSGNDVTITANDGIGHVSEIVLLGVTTPSQMIGSLQAFNALSVGNVSFVTAPTLVSSSPADNASSVAKSANLVLTFDENVTAVGGKNLVLHKSADDSVVASIAATSAQVSISGKVVTVNPTSDLADSTAYYVTVDAGAFKDASNQVYAGISDKTTLNFTTAAAGTTTSLDALNGTAQVPAAFDASTGSFSFTDSIVTASFVRITGFGANDSLALTNKGANAVVFENNGADVLITANDGAGHVTQITLVGVTDANHMIGSLAAFNALAVGDVTVS